MHMSQGVFLCLPAVTVATKVAMTMVMTRVERMMLAMLASGVNEVCG